MRRVMLAPPFQFALRLGVVALLTLGGLTAQPTARAAPAAQLGPAQFEPAPCPYEAGVIPPGEIVECGFLSVPEDRTITGSRTIRLAVAILRSPNPTPAPDPVLYLSGGPGSSGMNFIGYWLSAATAVRADRDIIMFDQRGTSYSEPNLDCWEFEGSEVLAAAASLSPEAWAEFELNTLRTCRDRLVAAGANLAAYHTAASAADVEDLRLALGIEEWNLYGHSYGTRLALTVLRDHPAGVRSVVLSSALPPPAGWWEEAATNAERAFEQIFAGCAADPACAAAFPDLEAQMWAVVGRLDAAPLAISVRNPATGALVPAAATGQDILEGGFFALYDSALIPYLPLAVAQIAAGNRSVVEGLGATRGTAPVRGMWYSVMCHDELPFNDPGLVEASVTAHPRYAVFVRYAAVARHCAMWGAGEAGPIENRAVHSAVPVLLLHGLYDPIHPPAWSEQAAGTLSNSTFIQLPEVGHAGGRGQCGQALTAEFFAQPSRALTNECPSARPGPAWITRAAINPGVYRLATGLLQPFNLAAALPFAVCGLVLASAPPAWLLGSWRKPRPPARRGERLARGLAALVAALHLGYAALLLYAIVTIATARPYWLPFGLPPEYAPLYVVPWVAGALSLVVAGLVVVAWNKREWSTAVRVHITLIVVAELAFFVLLWAWGLVGV